MAKMSISAAASQLNVSVDSIRRRLRSGVINGVRDDRGQWWLDLPDNVQPETPRPSIDQKMALGMAVPASNVAEDPYGIIETLQARIDDLLARLESSEKERREDKKRAANEHDRLLTMIENLTRQSTPR
jgi:hypothetical protein